ncbi:sperm flagellar protein 1 [Genypterus blacodes]|uniref:sperm flagellar protein 1 n=1 Tax=Genypterus blacodes TaxID=154954 RepID=UPI003F7751F3
MDRDLTQGELQDLYAWIDEIPLSRPKRQITRDFSDGVMAAEVVKYFFPKLVDTHNYSPANSTPQKLDNWNLLNRKVFSKLNFHVSEKIMKKIVLSTSGVIEPILNALRQKINQKLEQTTEDMMDLEYYDTRNPENLYTASRLIKSKHQDQTAEGRENKYTENSQPQQTMQMLSDMEPAACIILHEKDQAVMALQETVEILQMKVKRLEHLVHLKDMRIEDLTRHVEMYKAKANVS